MAAPLVRTDGFVASCIPSLAHKPPSGPDWVHEIKHDGYRLIVRRQGEMVPPVRAAARLRARSSGSIGVTGGFGGAAKQLLGRLTNLPAIGCHAAAPALKTRRTGRNKLHVDRNKFH
jgi:hypothetical protein